MVALTQTSAAQAATQTQATQTSDAVNSSSALSSDFETFLLMLTTQMQNQDPLNPVESEDFAVQLATFSGVEQQVRTNKILENLAGGMGATGLAQLAGWVGMEGRVTSPVAFDGAPIDLAPVPAAGADALELVVRDVFGNQVARESVPLGQDTIQWVGIGQTGAPLQPGTYTMQLASYSNGELLGFSEVPHYARINEARQAADGVELVMDGGTVVPSGEVTALRDPASDSI